MAEYPRRTRGVTAGLFHRLPGRQQVALSAAALSDHQGPGLSRQGSQISPAAHRSAALLPGLCPARPPDRCRQETHQEDTRFFRGTRMNTTARLRNAGRHPDTPCSLPVTGGALDVQQWLRVLPGKRLVGRGEWQGRQVLAKLFIATGAERHWQRESNGIQALQRAGLATPDLLASGELPGGGYYLLTEFLAGSQSLQQRWETLPDASTDSAAARAILQEALQLIAAMHREGLAQKDMHLGNFLEYQHQLYVIDGDAIEAVEPGKPLSPKAVEANLALFFAQFEPGWDQQIDSLLQCYLEVNPLPALAGDQLLRTAQVERQKRLDDFLGKTLRDCTQFAVTRRFRQFSVVLRSEQEALAPLLDDPDSAFAGTPLLKDGGSST